MNYTIPAELSEVEQLREELNYKVRCRVLEQLCHDLYLIYMEEFVDYAGFTARMNDLGLAIEGRIRVGRRAE